jgi:transcriptional regulator GlxA family with amidase domain
MTNISGPWEVLGHANDLLGREAYSMEAFGPGAPETATRFGLRLAGIEPLPMRVNQPPDIAIVAGASPLNPLPPDHAPLVPWLRRHHPRIKTVVSICTGAFVLAAAGILDGRRATTHWMYLNALRERFPKVHVVDEGIYVEDHGVWTSAGVTAGIDLTLALVEADHGHALAMRVAKRMVLFLRRSGYQAQFSSALQAQEQEPPRLRDISAFVIEHLGEELPVERIAAHAAMSPRTLSRWCRQHLNESPAELVRRVRLAEARRLLEETSLAMKEIADQTGLGDPSTLWRVFTHDMGLTPAEYRNRFASTRLGALQVD